MHFDVMSIIFDDSRRSITIFLQSVLSHLDCHFIKSRDNAFLQFFYVPWTSAVNFGLDEAPWKKSQGA